MTFVAETFIFANSSNLDECDYDPDTDNLTVRFQSGDEYTYFNVPPSVYRGLTTAPSAGEYFARQIRNRYQFEKS